MKTMLRILFVMSLLISVGCMNQAGKTSKPGLFGGGGSIVTPQTQSVLSGGVQGAGGSGPAGIITPADKQALQQVVNAPELNPQLEQGFDTALSQELMNEIRRIVEDERRGIEVLSRKWMVVPVILQQCAGKVAKLGPLPGDSVKGTWTKASGDCEIASFEVNEGSRQIHGLGGALQGGQLAAYPNGSIQIRSPQGFNGDGRDSGFRGNPQLSGVATLTGKRQVNSKQGPNFVACRAEVELATPKNQMSANHTKAMQLFGNCYNKGLALIAMDNLFQNMDPQLMNVLLKSSLR
ncbi:MAG: hypothetical protein ACKOA8_08165 [Deltaproteobacteria bacterium]